jgi:hypothetical protein
MRLGQLARKLSLRPSQVVDFLAASNIESEEGSNTRLKDDHVEMIVKHFAPERFEEILRPVIPEETIVEKTIQSTEEIPTDEAPVVSLPNEADEAPQQASEAVSIEPIELSAADAEVIRVQKIELAGLKVLGKIELPEPKKKEAAAEGEATDENKPQKRERSSKDRDKQTLRNREQHTRRNPVEAQRQREQREREEKRKAELEREKEKRKQHYHNKVKQVNQQPAKRAKLAKETSVVSNPKSNNTRPAPKTWLGKFLRWWTT